MAAIIEDTHTHSQVGDFDATTEPTAKLIRSMSLADIAGDLEAPIEDLKAFLEEHNATLIDFQGTILVPENEAIAAYEHYSVIRARQKMHERFSQPKTKSQPGEPPESNSSNKKRTYLTWKASFKVNKTSYRKTLEIALNALFPDREEEQTAALYGIKNKTDLGKAIVDKISRDSAYTDKGAAREKLFEAAEQLIQIQEVPDSEEAT